MSLEIGSDAPREAFSLVRVGRGVATLVLILVLGLALTEGLLQTASTMVSDRAAGDGSGSATILCVGDSHTYGSGVEPEQSYPARLQAELDQEAPGHYRVVNLGVPGRNTTQILRRLPDQARRHEASMILVWAGVNDHWNLSEVDARGASRWTRLDAFATRSRLYRLVRTRLHDRRIERDLAAGPGPGRARLTKLESGRWRVELDGSVEDFEPEARDLAVTDETSSRLADNYAFMASWAREAAIPIAFLTYPVETPTFAAVNESLASAAFEEGAPVLVTRDFVVGVPAEERRMKWSGHPTAAMYAAIAQRVADFVLATRPPP